MITGTDIGRAVALSVIGSTPATYRHPIVETFPFTTSVTLQPIYAT